MDLLKGQKVDVTKGKNVSELIISFGWTNKNAELWQFVGIGDSDFEVLKQLDTMTGRLIDNANFFHVDRIEEVSDEELYDQLLNEFPQWLQAAKAKRII